jgi:hypothetical protein
VITYSGVWCTPATGLVPEPSDIAVHSGRITRYAGALWSSLLAHHVFVAELVWAELMLQPNQFDHATWAWAFMHDAHETFMGEIPRRWKTPDRKAQEKAADARILKHYKLDGYKIEYGLIKRMDELALLAEATVLELPDWPAKYCQENNLSEMPPIPDAAIEMMESIVKSGFYQVEHCTNPNSYAVMGAAVVYSNIKAGQLESALNTFRRLLNNVLPEIEA